MIKAIIFDCFGVLTTDRWKEFVASLPEAQKQPARDCNHAFDRGEIDKSTFLGQIQTLTGKNPAEVEDLRDSDGTKNPDLLSYIAELKPRYKIGLLSNVASNWIRENLLTQEEQALFDDMVMSFEVRVTKPDPRIFHIAADRLGIDIKDCVLVDDIETYCQAARQEGMQAILYQNFKQVKAELEALLAKT